MQATTDNTFKADVLESKLPTLVDFWATWCTPCKNLMPILEAVLKGFEGRLKGFSLNVETSPHTPTSYNIMSLPTLILFHKGEVLDLRVGGSQDEDDLKTWLEDTLKNLG